MVRHWSLPSKMVETEMRCFNSLESVRFHDGADQSKRPDGIVCLISQILSDHKQINHLHNNRPEDQPTWSFPQFPQFLLFVQTPRCGGKNKQLKMKIFLFFRFVLNRNWGEKKL